MTGAEADPPYLIAIGTCSLHLILTADDLHLG
jgi:hypothetical protein